MTTQALAPRESAAIVREELTIEELVAQVQKIQQAMSKVMKDGEHFGVIPGTQKPTLYKAGAEKLGLLFRLDPEYDTKPVIDGQHLTAITTCTLYHIPTGNRVASGQGLCTSRESKYAFRKGERVCPECGSSAIIKGKAEYGGGWLCYAKKGGCSAKWPDGAEIIEQQEVGQIANPNPADTWNTIVKMACKRALVAAVLNATAASDIFTQDLEDIAENTLATAAPATPAMPSAKEAAAKASRTAPMPQTVAGHAGEFTALAKSRGWSQMETVQWARSVMSELVDKPVKNWSEEDYAVLLRRLKEWSGQEQAATAAEAEAQKRIEESWAAMGQPERRDPA
jgi:hypothetical protein